MSWGMFTQIVLLIIIFCVAKNAVKCLHDKYCLLCKKDGGCCK